VKQESNTQIEVQIGGVEDQSPDHQLNNPDKSDKNISMFSKQLERFMESVMAGFDNLNRKFTVITLNL
jgi:hypothetical protein